MPTPPELLLLCAISGWVAVDGTSLGQFMVSRPLVAAVLAGAVVGDPTEAARLGVILEVLYLGVLPIGAARYPEPGPPAVVGGAMVAFVQGPGGLLSVLAFVLFWAWVAGESVRVLRQWNASLAEPANITGSHLLGIGRDFGRGALLAAAGFPLLAGLLAATAPRLAGTGAGSAFLIGAVTVAALAAATRAFGERRMGRALFGAALGLLALLLR